MNVKQRAKQLKTDIPAVGIALGKKETPMIAKALAGLTIAYAFSPIDLIPDFIPVLGYLDDIILLPGLVALTIHFIPKDIFEQCRKIAQVNKNQPKHNWYFAIPILLFWLIILLLLIKAIL